MPFSQLQQQYLKLALSEYSFMKIVFFVLFFSTLLILQIPLVSTELNHDLLQELKWMRERDQDVRFKILTSRNPDAEEVRQNLERIDQEHLPRLKEIIHQFGWPGFELVGEQGADNIWLLIQHCDQDLKFQKICLGLLEEAVAKKDAPKWHLAYLMDRVLVNAGEEQIYGTQIQIIKGEAIAHPIQGPQDLDKRREEMGLCPFAEYLSLLKKIHQLEK